MTRTVRNWVKESISNFEVAPHRYVWEGFDESFRSGKYRECMEGAPYKPGEVLYFWSGNAAVKARVMIVFARRASDGDLREFYRVQPETIGGYWAKCWKYVHPGDDQGDWEFSFEGRSGGWLVLQKWRGLDINRQVEEMDSWDYNHVRTLYRALVCMDHDFTPANASAAVEAQLNFIRFNWEEERRQEQAEKVLAQAESYADHPLYNGLYEAKAA